MKLAIIDFNRTLYDPDTGGLIAYAEEMLKTLTDMGVRLVLVSKDEGGREDVLASLGITPYFAETVFTPKKTPELFVRLIENHGSTIEETYVIGDYLAEEITHGNAAGLKTIRLVRGKFAHHMPSGAHDTPWRSVDSLHSVAELIA